MYRSVSYRTQFSFDFQHYGPKQPTDRPAQTRERGATRNSPAHLRVDLVHGLEDELHERPLAVRGREALAECLRGRVHPHISPKPLAQLLGVHVSVHVTVHLAHHSIVQFKQSNVCAHFTHTALMFFCTISYSSSVLVRISHKQCFYTFHNAVSVFKGRKMARGGGRGVVLDVIHGRSRMTIEPRSPTMPGRSTSGCHRPGGTHVMHSRSCMTIDPRREEGSSQSHNHY